MRLPDSARTGAIARSVQSGQHFAIRGCAIPSVSAAPTCHAPDWPRVSFGRPGAKQADCGRAQCRSAGSAEPKTAHRLGCPAGRPETLRAVSAPPAGRQAPGAWGGKPAIPLGGTGMRLQDWEGGTAAHRGELFSRNGGRGICGRGGKAPGRRGHRFTGMREQLRRSAASRHPKRLIAGSSGDSWPRAGRGAPGRPWRRGAPAGAALPTGVFLWRIRAFLAHAGRPVQKT